MITLPNYNSQKYTILLQKAWNDLYNDNKLKSVDRDAANNGKDRFSNLQHYFSYIQELISLDKNYIMMPIDETPFVIDTNSRFITVPPLFSNCGGVQSDSYAEIITFTVDRYFDYQDLSNVNIAVQWRNESSRVEGVSVINLIDLETYGSENKIRFGWPLTKEMTSAAGTLRFAVRFFKEGLNVETGKEEILYILKTLASSITIKSTLNNDLNNPNLVVKEKDYENFLNFVVNSPNPSYTIPTPVEFVKALPKQAKLNKDNTLTLEGWAKTKDGNVLIYEWYRKLVDTYVPYNTIVDDLPEKKPNFNLYLYDNQNNKYVEYNGVWPPKKITVPEVGEPVEELYQVSDFYVYEPSILLEDSDKFDVTTSMEKYKPLNEDGQFSWPELPPKDLTFWTLDESIVPPVYKKFIDEWPIYEKEEDVKLYTHLAKLTFKNMNLDNPDSKNILGKYYLKAINRIEEDNKIVNEVSAISPVTGYCSINPPQKINFTQDLSGTYLLSQKNTLSIALQKDDNQPEYTYELRKYGNLEDYTVINSTTSSNPSIQFTVLDYGRYRIYVTSDLNRHNESRESGECQLLNSPVQVTGTMYHNGRVATDVVNDILKIDAKTSTEVNKISVKANLTGNEDQSTIGNISFTWEMAKNNADYKPINLNSINSGFTYIPSSDPNDSGTLEVVSSNPAQDVISYKCTIENTISTETKAKEYIFTII